MINRWHELQKRPLTRKDFLKMSGLGLLVILNLDAVVRLLTGSSLTHDAPKAQTGYGASGYSGFISDSNVKKESPFI